MKIKLIVVFMFLSLGAIGQTGHIMQGVGAVNMSMGGAATAQPLDINGPMLWNPAALTSFDQSIISVNAGAFFSSPKLTSSLPAGMLGPGAPAVSGTTADDRGVSIMPAVSAIWKKPGSNHVFGISAFGISGFGVTFPEEINNPLNDNFNPMLSSNPINYPQQAGGFGLLQSDYMLMQVGFTYAYKISQHFSLGFQPTFNYAGLKLLPNPLASPGAAGYPTSDRASALGVGGQAGIYYQSLNGIKLGASYKSKQFFKEFEFKNTYLDNSQAPGNQFTMNYPEIISIGAGYSKGMVDVGVDYRYVLYENTEGFDEQGWTPTASVKGFGWKNMNIISAGVQLKAVKNLPLRFGYTYSTNPIDENLAFFSTPATAIIKHAFQFGAGYNLTNKLVLNGVFHYGTSAGSTEGKLLNPMMISPSNPIGEIPGSIVSYSMTTSMVMLGVNYFPLR